MIGMAFNQLESFKLALPYLMTAAELDKDKRYRSSISIWSCIMSIRNV